MKTSKLFLTSAAAVGLLALSAVGCGGSDGPRTGGGGNGGGGNGGSSGGNPCAGDLGSDFESDAAIKVNAGMGYWYFYDDMKGSWDPPADNLTGPPRADGGGSCSSGKALRAHWVPNGAAWGAGAGTDLAEAATPGVKTPVDLSAYKGITFQAKAAEAVTVLVKFPDQNTDAQGPAKSCVDNGTAPSSVCSQFLAKVMVGTSWAPHTVLFKDLAQDIGIMNYKKETAFAQAGVTGLQFQVNSNWGTGTAQPVPFDLYLDDVYFIK